jgi:hypothetical protein
MEREINTAPAVLPSIQSNFQFRRPIIARTAPALSNIEKFTIPPLTPMTKRQNEKLSEQLKLLNKIMHGSPDGQTDGIEDSIAETQINLAAIFDKNWSELMHLIDFAKNMNEKESTNELFSMGLYSSAKIKQLGKTEQKRDITYNPTSKTSGNTIGRKPIRIIMEDIQRRMLMLQSNPSLWEELEATVEKYSPSNRSNKKNMIKLNKVTATPAEKILRNIELKKAHQDQIDKVLKSKQNLDKRDLQRRTRTIREKDERLARILATERDFSGNLQTIQARWFVIVFVASRVKYLQTELNVLSY